MAKCWFHKWSKWATKQAFVGEYIIGGGTAMVITQERYCAKCGKIELNRQVA